MSRRRFDRPYQLLNWVLQRGQLLLAVRVSRAGDRYQVSVSSPRESARLYAESCRGGASALRLHAALVVGFREAGWRSVGYR